MFIKQIAVFMENKPGQVADITKILSDSNIDIRAVNIADTTDFGILRMIVSSPDRAEHVLREHNMSVSTADVIAISIDDAVGSFAEVVSLFKYSNINIDYLYSFIGESAKAVVVIKTNNGKEAVKLMNEHKITVLSPNEIRSLSNAE